MRKILRLVRALPTVESGVTTFSMPQPDSRTPSPGLQLARHDVHPLELTACWVIAAELVFLPWAYGGMRIWSHVVALVLALAAFVVALLPRYYDDRSTGEQPFWLYTWPKLLRFPLFWLGLVFLGYVAIQAINPAWEYQTDGVVFWMRNIPENSHWPAGMRAPLAQWNPWRMLMIYSTVWLTVCALWIATTRRRTLHLILTTIAANGLVLAMLGLIYRMKNNGKFLWFLEPPTHYFVASIPYKNHAATYFNLVVAVTLALGFWVYLRDERRMEKSSPAPLYGFAAAIMAMMVIFSFSRAGVILMICMVAATLAALGLYEFRRGAEKRSFAISFALLLVLAGFVGVTAYALGVDRVIARFENLFGEHRRMSIDARIIVRDATLEMARDRLAYGWGAGCFRFGFPIYQMRYDKIAYDWQHQRMFWEHAHNDWVQVLAEFGIVGCSIIASLLACAVAYAVRSRFWRNPVAAVLAIALATTLLHAWVDFPFQNPAILTTWCVFFIGLILWAELDEVTVRLA